MTKTMVPVPNNVYDRTIRDMGGTFVLHGENGKRETVSFGYAVAVYDGTWRKVRKDNRKAFNATITDAVRTFPDAYAIGTWVDTDDDTIHIDPVMVTQTEDDAVKVARDNHQIAYYILHENREVRL